MLRLAGNPNKESQIGARDLQGTNRSDGRVSIAIVTLLVVGLAGCASDLMPRPDHPVVDAAPYMGVFTGQFVDGRPLYRLPTVEVVGLRSGIGRPYPDVVQ